MPISEQGSVAAILCRALNHVDERLYRHGERVAYMALQMMRTQGGYGEQTLQDLFLLASLHDIGAYRTEEIDQMITFETKDVWEHSIYGALLIENLSPLHEYAQVLLFHHTPFSQMERVEEPICRYAQIINLVDRVDVFLTAEKREGLADYLESERGRKFSPQVIELFWQTEHTLHILEQVASDAYLEETWRMLRSIRLSRADCKAFLEMLIGVIDFRSAYTAMHTGTTVAVARRLAELMELPQAEIEDVCMGALLHDVGKIAVPVALLESEGRLTAAEEQQLKSHVATAEEILGQDVRPAVLRIVMRHHECPNGTGYPGELTDAELTLPERIVALADAVSALRGEHGAAQTLPKQAYLERIGILADEGVLDSRAAEVFCRHYDDIIACIDRYGRPFSKKYMAIRWEYELSLAQWSATG